MDGSSLLRRGGRLLFWLLPGLELVVLWHLDQVHRLVSGSATPVLEAASILQHGNGLLRGWFVSSDAYLFTDLPFYVAGVALGGVSAPVAHAVTWVVTVVNLAGFWVLMRRAAGARAAWAAVTAWLGLSPVVLWLAGFGNIHVGTIGLGWWLWTAATAFLYPQGPRAGGAWGSLTAAGVLAWLVAVSDPYAWVVVLLPAVAATWLDGRARPAWWRQVLMAVLLLAGAAASEARTWLDHHGVVMATLPAAFVPWAQVGPHLGRTLAGLWQLTGGWVLGRPLTEAGTMLRLIRLLLAGVAGWGWAGFFRSRPRGPARWWASALLAAAGFTALAGTFSTLGGPVRYLWPWSWWEAAGLGLWVARLTRRDWGREGWVVLVGAAVVAAGLVQGWQKPASAYTRAREQLLQVLTAARIPAVLSTAYEWGNDLTVQSRGRLRALSVAFRGGRLVPFNWEADVRWYRPQAGPVPALLLSRGQGRREGAAIRRQFGPPLRVLRVADKTVWVWSSSLTPRLGPPWFRVPGD
ncbi:membrane protein of unknown function [Candidatus Hydrogenisulfobacillus filiaventi]|uniref:Uncharacterized protein n=1 Tax=Candidatus Hydrogenisulfobacillus filiaventi TaxID=2707344 RepID=A0A6F8ZEH5_9FIRM|nr:membrane protein of unknown function [Candidatus Hydrogenisulfobacillus filiaventi]